MVIFVLCIPHAPPSPCYRSSKRTIDTPLASTTDMQSASVSLNDIASVDACHSLHNPSLLNFKAPILAVTARGRGVKGRSKLSDFCNDAALWEAVRLSECVTVALLCWVTSPSGIWKELAWCRRWWWLMLFPGPGSWK